MSRSTERLRTRAAAAAVAASMLLLAAAAEAGGYPGIGRPATPAEIAAWDIDVRPDFKGLPPGSGSVAKGQQVWDAKCASCHGTFGESNEVFTPLVGGTTAEDMKTGRTAALTRPDVARTTMMKLSTLSTLWDYVRRAMPWNAPKSLTTEEVYAVVAYMLNLADIVPGDFVLSERNIAEVQAKLPNRNGMTRDHGLWDLKGKPDVKNAACMKDCSAGVETRSSLPVEAKDAHGDLSAQHREVGPVRGARIEAAAKAQPTAAAAKAQPAAAPLPVAELARRKACLTCHGVDKRIVGPGLREVGERYRGQADAPARLLEKLKRGGSGVWGPLPMPPNPDLAEADGKRLIEWIIGGAR
ncbi:MAG TPA: c-type cytochrome [Usitatibacter sp.]|nr:c-type cytochrome [Usitatibacter sp.]